eukprot:4487514-Prymnesium_polylepis.2
MSRRDKETAGAPAGTSPTHSSSCSRKYSELCATAVARTQASSDEVERRKRKNSYRDARARTSRMSASHARPHDSVMTFTSRSLASKRATVTTRNRDLGTV